MEEYLGHHDLRTCHPCIFRVKSTVYSSDVANVEQLKEKIIIIAFATLKLRNNTLENVRRNLMRRAELCMQQRGRRFQRFLN